MRHLSWVGLPVLFVSAAAAQDGFTIPCDSLDGVSVIAGSTSLELRETDGRTAIAMVDQSLDDTVLAFGPACPVTPGEAYLLAVDMRGVGLNSCQVRPEIHFTDATGNQVGSAYGDWIIRSAPWRRIRVVGVAPEGAETARIAIHGAIASMVPLPDGHRTGAALVDNIAWIPVPRVDHRSSVKGNTVEEGGRIELSFHSEGAPPGHRWLWHGAVTGRPDEAVSTIGDMDLGDDTTWTLSFDDYERGHYEVRWWVERDGELCFEGRVPFAVVPPLSEQPFDPESPVALDAGFSWFVADDPERLRLAARLARMAGLTCLRDRLSWAQTNPAEGVYDWGRYADSARAQAEAGITVYQVMHDCPEWAAETGPNPVSPRAAPPRDLRDAYRYFREASAHFASEIPYWEIWNEPDIFFFAGRPEEYAGILKAAYLGVHHGNPQARVLLGSLAMPPGEWYRRALECGLSDYIDIWNMHYYGPPEGVINRIEANRRLMLDFGPEKPIWLTEMGIPANPADDGTYTESEREQASYLVKAYSHSLGHGVDRFFFFFMHEFLEAASSLWGITHADLTPKPAYSALAQYAALLGDRHCLGRLDLGDEALYAYAWGPADDAVVVLWRADGGPLPDLPYARALDLMGRHIPIPSLGPTPIYLTGVDARAMPLTADAGPVLSAPAPANLDTLGVVLDLRLLPPNDAPVGTPERKAAPRLRPTERLPLRLGVYNFTNEPAAVEPTLVLPDGWTLDPAPPARVDVAPGDLAEYELALVPEGMRPTEEYSIRLEGRVDGRAVAPAVAYVAPARDAFEPVETHPLADIQEWQATSSQNVDFSIEPADGDALRNHVTMPPEGDRWAMANCLLTDSDALPRYDSIAVEFRSGTPAPESLIVILVERDGSQYMAVAERAFLAENWTEHRFWIPEFALNQWVSSDENETLDLDEIDRILFGASFTTGLTEAEWWIRGARLQRF